MNFFAKIPESFIEALSVRSLCSLNPITSLCYLSSLNRRSALLILNSFSGRRPPFLMKKPLFSQQFDWQRHCLTKIFDVEADTNFDFDLFYKSVLQRIKSVYATNIINFLNDNTISKESDEIKLFHSFFLLLSEFQPLYYSLKERCLPDDLRFEGSKIKLIDRIGNKFFECSPSISFDYLKMNNMEELYELFELPAIYQNSEKSKEIQNSFFNSHLFPKVSFFGGSSSLGSLFNTSAVKREHFIDIVMKLSINSLENSNFEEAIKFLALFPDLQSYSFICILHKKINDINWLSAAVQQTENIKKCDILKRIKSDLSLVNEIQNWTGQLTTMNELKVKSIPFIFKMFLLSLNEEPFRNLREMSLFSISDEKWQIDNDFIDSFFTLFYAIKLFETNDDCYFDNIEFHISRISNKKLLFSLSVDLFSLLFLKNNNNEYFTWRTTAERLLTILLSVSDDETNNFSKCLSSAFNKIQCVSVLFPHNLTIDSVLFPSIEIFANSLEKKEFDIIQMISASDPKLSVFSHRHKQICNYEKNKSLDSLDDPFIRLEILCSYDSASQQFNNFKGNFDSFPIKFDDLAIDENDLNILIENRKSQKNLQFIVEENKIEINRLSLKLSKLSVTTWCDTPKVENCKLLNSFFNYLDKMIPPLLETKNNKTIVDCLSIEPRNILSTLVKNNEINAAHKISEIFQIDLIESIVKSGSTSQECISVLSNEGKVLPICQTLNEKDYFDDYSEILKKYKIRKHSKSSLNYSINLNIHNENAKNAEDIIKCMTIFDDSQQNGVPKIGISEAIKKLIIIKPLPITELIEVLWRSNEDEFLEILFPVLPTTNLNDLLTVCSECFFDKIYEIIAALIEVSKIVSPFPLSTSFSFLLADKNYKLAAKICTHLKYFFNALKIVREEVLKAIKNGEKIDDLLELDPSFENELIQSLPHKYRIEGITADFFEKIPTDWKRQPTPHETILANLEDMKTVVQFFDQYDFLNIDKDILSWINAKITISDEPIIRKIPYLMNIIRQNIPIIRNLNEIIQLVVKSLIQFISLFSVYDPHSELTAYIALNKINSALLTLNNIKEKYLLKSHVLDSLDQIINYSTAALHFTEKFPCTKFGTQYSFGNLTQPSTGELLAKYCYLYDFLKTAEDVSKAWNISTSVLQDEYALKCCKINVGFKNSNKKGSRSFGDSNDLNSYSNALSNTNNNDLISDELNEFMCDRRQKKSQRTISIVRDYVCCFSHLSFFDPNVCSILSDLAEVETLVRVDFFKFDDYDSLLSSPSKTPVSIFKKLFSKSPNSPASNESVSKSFSNSDLNKDSLLNDEKNEPHFYKRIQKMCIVDESVAPAVIVSSKKLTHYLKWKAPIFERIYYYASVGKFEKALSLFIKIENFPSKQEKWNIFLEGLFIPSIAYNYLSRMLFRIKCSDYIRFFGSLFEKLLSIAMKSELINLQYEIQMMLERYDQATVTAINIFKETDSIKIKLRSLDLALRAAIEDIKITSSDENKTENKSENKGENRFENKTENNQNEAFDNVFVKTNSKNAENENNNEKSSNPEKNDGETKAQVRKVKANFDPSVVTSPNKPLQRKRMYSKELIYEYTKLISLQKQFCEFCEFSNLNLFSGRSNCEQMVVFLLKNEQFRLVVDIIIQTQVSLKQVSTKLVDILLNEEDENIINVVKRFEKIAPGFMFKIFISEMIVRAAYILNDERLVSIFLKTIEEKRLKCALLVEFYRFEEAFATAKEGKIEEFLPMIANLASKEGKLQLMYDITHYIEKINKAAA
ncbi:hypothetical protein TRFO_20302 [Tritrichomonas foetus]|uniref:Uncharacterized protein n=1 Tax=Tritrichomonas foetus TaxID=1144522 RepID=A0A1J4KGS9_9EUKA|nr:hypothetical protein TRFO_20302 [Tritrichomonas foetus]|eukprot:OHT10419.1 hypothetical protein TRFO_20302 [Tritrichomonas foetus]